MKKEDLIRNLKYTEKKHQNDTVDTFGTNISMMCSDVLRVLENCIEIPDGATNGDMIKTMFPNIECMEDILGNVFVISNAQLGHIVFRESWWNAPYKGVEDEQKRTGRGIEKDKSW